MLVQRGIIVEGKIELYVQGPITTYMLVQGGLVQGGITVRESN